MIYIQLSRMNVSQRVAFSPTVAGLPARMAALRAYDDAYDVPPSCCAYYYVFF